MKKTKKSNLITRLRKRDIYNPATVEEDLDKVRELYHNAGYKNLVVGRARARRCSRAARTAKGRPKKRELGIVIPVEEGERWKLGDILIEGNEVLPDEFLKNAFEEPKGGWLRQDVIDKGLKQIEEFYSNTGYMFARIDARAHRARRPGGRRQAHHRRGRPVPGRAHRVLGQQQDQGPRAAARAARAGGHGLQLGAAQEQHVQHQPARVLQAPRGGPGRARHRQRRQEGRPDDQGRRGGAHRAHLRRRLERDRRLLRPGRHPHPQLPGPRRDRWRSSSRPAATPSSSTSRTSFPGCATSRRTWLPALQARPRLRPLLVSSASCARRRAARSPTSASIGPWSNVSLSYSNAAYEDFRSFNFFGDDTQVVSQQFDFTRSSVNLGWTYDKRDSQIEPTRGLYTRASLEYAGGFLGGGDCTTGRSSASPTSSRFSSARSAPWPASTSKAA